MNFEGNDVLVMGRCGARKIQAKLEFGMELNDRIAVDIRLDDALIRLGQMGAGSWGSERDSQVARHHAHSEKRVIRPDSESLWRPWKKQCLARQARNPRKTRGKWLLHSTRLFRSV